MNGEIAEPATPLRNYNLLVPEKKSYFREFQPEKQLSFLSPSLSTVRIIFPRDFGPGTITSLSKIHRGRKSWKPKERKKERKGKLEWSRIDTLLFHDCDYDSFNLRAELLAYARFVSRFRRIARKFVSSLIARGEKGREESRVCQSCGCRGGIGTAVHGSVRPTASTKHLCSNINTGNRGDSQSLLGFVTPVAEFTRLPGGYPYTVFADTSPRTCNLYAVHAHAFPASLARFDI